MAESCEAKLPSGLRCYARSKEAAACWCGWFLMHCDRPGHEREAGEALGRHKREAHQEAVAVSR